jgi:6-phosphogluconolactonase
VTTPLVVVHHDPNVLAEAVAARLITRIADVQAARSEASVVLTGGGVGTASLAAIARSPARSAVDWAHLEVWWGDERFLPSGHAERNETQAREALLDHVPVNLNRVHPMPASDAGDVRGDPEAAADLYRETLAASAHPENHSRVPAFDVLLLGVGPDAHVASLFPDQPALYETRPVVAVHGAPKPPPIRLTLTLPAIRTAHEVWLVVAGDEKAAAVRMALSGAGEVQVPAAGARGRHRTLWLLDRAAASALPRGLERIASP